MDGQPADGTACFAHGLAHLIIEHGYEKGLAIAGRTVLDLLERPDEGVRIDCGGEEPIRRFNLRDTGIDAPPAWGVRPSVSLSSLDVPAGPNTHLRRACGSQHRGPHGGEGDGS